MKAINYDQMNFIHRIMHSQRDLGIIRIGRDSYFCSSPKIGRTGRVSVYDTSGELVGRSEEKMIVSRSESTLTAISILRSEGRAQ